MITKAEREVKAIIMCRAISLGGTKKKADARSSHVALTPFDFELQGFYGLGYQF
jgi:hypothetical protein